MGSVNSNLERHAAKTVSPGATDAKTRKPQRLPLRGMPGCLLDASIALHLHVPRPAACLLSSQSPYLYTSTSLRLQRSPRAPESRAPYLYTSHTSLRMHRGPRVPDLHTSIISRVKIVWRITRVSARHRIKPSVPSASEDANPYHRLQVDLMTGPSRGDFTLSFVTV